MKEFWGDLPLLMKVWIIVAPFVGVAWVSLLVWVISAALRISYL